MTHASWPLATSAFKKELFFLEGAHRERPSRRASRGGLAAPCVWQMGQCGEHEQIGNQDGVLACEAKREEGKGEL